MLPGQRLRVKRENHLFISKNPLGLNPKHLCLGYRVSGFLLNPVVGAMASPIGVRFIPHLSKLASESPINRDSENRSAPSPIGVELRYQQGQLSQDSLTSSPSRVDAPTRKMLIAALRSRTVPQSLHCQFLSRRFNVSLTTPQTEQVLLEGYHLSMKVILTPFFLAIYTNFLTKSAKPKSLTFNVRISLVHHALGSGLSAE